MPFYPPAEKEQYVVRGSWVHGCCLWLLQGKEPNVSDSLEAIHRNRPHVDIAGFPNYLKGMRLWLSLNDVEFIAGEVAIEHKALMYQGKYDAKCKVNGKLSRLELKTGVKIPNYTPLQTALYDMADEYTQRIGLLLRPDGQYEEYGPGKEPPYSRFADYGAAKALATWYWNAPRYK